MPCLALAWTERFRAAHADQQWRHVKQPVVSVDEIAQLADQMRAVKLPADVLVPRNLALHAMCEEVARRPKIDRRAAGRYLVN